jgi:hypothetical protein
MIMRVTVCDINVGVALVKFNEIALTFESRAGGRHRCDMNEAFTVHCTGAGRTKPTLKIDSWSPSARGWLDRNGSWKRLSLRKTATFECPARCFFGHGDYRRRS